MGAVKINKINQNNKINLKEIEITPDTIRIDNILKNFVQSAIDSISEYGNSEVEKIECFRRDGFIPHSYNKGGYSTNIIMSIYDCPVNESIGVEIDKNNDYIRDACIEEFGEGFNPFKNEDHQEFEYDFAISADLNLYYIEARAMYNGFKNEKHSTSFELIARLSDAPYFRYADYCSEFYVEYTDAESLKSILSSKKILETLIKDIGYSKNKTDFREFV